MNGVAYLRWTAIGAILGALVVGGPASARASNPVASITIKAPSKVKAKKKFTISVNGFAPEASLLDVFVRFGGNCAATLEAERHAASQRHKAPVIEKFIPAGNYQETRNELSYSKPASGKICAYIGTQPAPGHPQSTDEAKASQDLIITKAKKK